MTNSVSGSRICNGIIANICIVTIHCDSNYNRTNVYLYWRKNNFFTTVCENVFYDDVLADQIRFRFIMHAYLSYLPFDHLQHHVLPTYQYSIFTFQNLYNKRSLSLREHLFDSLGVPFCSTVISLSQ